MIGLFLKCAICPVTLMFPAAKTKTAVRVQATRDGWKCGVKLDLCPEHAERFNQLAERGK